MNLADKVKTAAEVAAIIGARPRGDSVALAAGTWDVVHPGHVAHLLYTKEKVGTLIACVTADAFVNKRIEGVHVPQELRAMNLAALAMVDYVIIDHHAEPLEVIAELQPDFYAKGFDYADMHSPKTQAESDLVASYGGQILFTPGDVMYSSSKLIRIAPPSLRYDKLRDLMKRREITFTELRECVTMMAGHRVHVIGDLIVDAYTETSMIGGQTKTPTISVKLESVKQYVGGAGIVTKHLAAAGARVTFSTVVGQDEPGGFAIADLQRADVDCLAIADESRPTTVKNAIVCDGYRLLKLDTVDNRSISANVLARLQKDLRDVESDAVVFSDFRHGIFNASTIDPLTASIRAPFRVADSQVASRWGNITDFEGFDLITPNEREARFALGDQDSVVRSLAADTCNRADARNLILKLGDRGLIGCDDGPDNDNFFTLDSFTNHCVDAVGAGDAMLAYSTLAMLVSDDLAISSIIGAVAAALECERDGNIPITPAEVMERLEMIERGCNYS